MFLLLQQHLHRLKWNTVMMMVTFVGQRTTVGAYKENIFSGTVHHKNCIILYNVVECGTMTQIPIFPDAPATVPVPSVKPNINIELF